MEANKILQADILDIIFDGRNKDYGAYNLRKSYNKRLSVAMAVMVSAIIVFTGTYALARRTVDDTQLAAEVPDTILVEIPDQPVIEPPPPVIPKPQPKIEMIRSTTPVIVPDKFVEDKDMPPVVDDIADKTIGSINQPGDKGDEIVAPPIVDGERGIITPPVKSKASDEPLLTVQVESQYPGGAGAWMRYLNKTFRYPQEAQETEMQGMVVVQFIVDREGNVSEVEAISGPAKGGLKEEAIRVIKASGKWEPAIQNGQKVKSYKKQPIIFRLDI